MDPISIALLATGGTMLAGGLGLGAYKAFGPKPHVSGLSQYNRALAALQKERDAAPILSGFNQARQELAARMARAGMPGSGAEEAAQRDLANEAMRNMQSHQTDIARQMAQMMAQRGGQAYDAQLALELARQKAQQEFAEDLAKMGGSLMGWGSSRQGI